MGKYDDHECALPMCVHHEAAKHECDHLDAVNRTRIHLKKMTSYSIRAPRFVVDHTTEDVPVCDAAFRVAADMVSKLNVYGAANIIELFVQTLVVLQTSSNGSCRHLSCKRHRMVRADTCLANVIEWFVQTLVVLQTSSNGSCRHLLSCKRPQFLT
ncbi:hypothetical protein TNCV_2473851 [Trichonephila clavipes]|nr:hypothetical protein TNCV_2473851 [Trichonephila clavipes]